MKKLPVLCYTAAAVLPVGAALWSRSSAPDWVLVAITVAMAVCVFFAVFFARKQRRHEAETQG